MKHLLLLGIAFVLTTTFLTGCKTSSGSREFIPGRGWVPTK